MTPQQITLDGKLHVILGAVLGDKALDVWCNTEDGHGLEVWRKLARQAVPRIACHNLGRPVHLVNLPQDVLNGDFQEMKDKWDNAEKEYTRLTGKTVPEDIRVVA